MDGVYGKDRIWQNKERLCAIGSVLPTLLRVTYGGRQILWDSWKGDISRSGIMDLVDSG